MNRHTITEEILRNRLRHNVRARRNAASLTLKKASERAEMHWRHWQKIEAGQVNLTVQTLVRIADVLGVDPFELLLEPTAALLEKVRPTPQRAPAPTRSAEAQPAPTAPIIT